MKIIAIAIAFVLLAPGTMLAQNAPAAGAGPRLQLDSLDRLAAEASDVVNISIDAAMLQLASAFIKGGGGEAAVKELLSGLKGIYVRTFEFDRDRVTAADLEPIRKQLAASRWSRIVTADSKRDRELAEVYTWLDGDASGGLAILVAQPTQLTVVNIVGPIDLSKFGALEGQFGIPRLPGDASATQR